MRAAPRRQAAFDSSDRRVRGRIVATLAQSGSLTLRALALRLGDVRVTRLARVLADEGLIEFARGHARLPTDALGTSARVQPDGKQRRSALVSRP